MKTQVILACLAVLIACAAVQVTGQWGIYSLGKRRTYSKKDNGFYSRKESKNYSGSGKYSERSYRGGWRPYAGAQTVYEELLDRLEKVEKRRCDTGYEEADICDPHNPDHYYGKNNHCILEYVKSGELNVTEIEVEFESEFEDVPKVTAGLSGIFSSTDKNCTVEATDVTKEGFNIKITLGGIYPFKLRLFWFACDAGGAESTSKRSSRKRTNYY